MARRFIPLPDFDPLASNGNFARTGERLIVGTGGRFAAIDLRRAELLWDRTWPRPSPEHYRVPRRPYAHGLCVWARGDTVVCLHETELGVAATSLDGATGKELWQRDVETPAPAEWAEEKPAWSGAPTEEIAAMLLATDELALVLARNSRRVMQWPDCPAPPRRGQLDVFAIDPGDGSVSATSSQPNVFVPILEKHRLGRYFVAGKNLVEINPVTAVARTVIELSHEPCWPRERDGRLTVCFRARGANGAASIDARSGAIVSSHTWKRKKATELALHPVEGGMVVGLGSQFVALLGEDLAPRWEVQVKPYVYGVAAKPDGPIFVVTSGNGGGLYAFVRDTGELAFEARLDGGAWNALPVPGRERVAALSVRGLLIADVRRAAAGPELVELAGVYSLVAAGEGRLAVVAGAPAPGVHVIDID